MGSLQSCPCNPHGWDHIFPARIRFYFAKKGKCHIFVKLYVWQLSHSAELNFSLCHMSIYLMFPMRTRPFGILTHVISLLAITCPISTSVVTVLYCVWVVFRGDITFALRLGKNRERNSVSKDGEIKTFFRHIVTLN